MHSNKRPEVNVGSLIRLHDRIHRTVARFRSDDRLLMEDMEDHRIFLVQTSTGDLGLPTHDDVARMIDAGTAELAPRATVHGNRLETERMRIELSLLDAAGVKNGTKAIAIWLYANWTKGLRDAYGPSDDAATIKRWRTASRSAARANCASAEREPSTSDMHSVRAPR